MQIKKKAINWTNTNNLYYKYLCKLQILNLKKREKYRTLYRFSKLKGQIFSQQSKKIYKTKYIYLYNNIKKKEKQKFLRKTVFNTFIFRIVPNEIKFIKFFFNNWVWAYNTNNCQFLNLWTKYKYTSKLLHSGSSYYNSDYNDNLYEKLFYKIILPTYGLVLQLIHVWQNLKNLPAFQNVKNFNSVINLVIFNLIKKYWTSKTRIKKSLIKRYYKYLMLWNYANVEYCNKQKQNNFLLIGKCNRSFIKKKKINLYRFLYKLLIKKKRRNVMPSNFSKLLIKFGKIDIWNKNLKKKIKIRPLAHKRWSKIKKYDILYTWFLAINSKKSKNLNKKLRFFLTKLVQMKKRNPVYKLGCKKNIYYTTDYIRSYKISQQKFEKKTKNMKLNVRFLTYKLRALEMNIGGIKIQFIIWKTSVKAIQIKFVIRKTKVFKKNVDYNYDAYAWQNRFSVSHRFKNEKQLKFNKHLLKYKLFRKRLNTIFKYKKLKIVKKMNFFLTRFGINYVYNIYTHNYFQIYKYKKKTQFLVPKVSWYPIAFENLICLITEPEPWKAWYIHTYLRFHFINLSKPITWKYWDYYFTKTIRYSTRTYENMSKYIVNKKKKRGFRRIKNIRQTVMLKRGWSWIDKLILKRNLYRKRQLPVKRAKRYLWKRYRNTKLPNKFRGNHYYRNLRKYGYNFKYPAKLKFRWKFKRNIILKSIRYFYGQLTYKKLITIGKNVDRRTSIFTNRYDKFFGKLDNQLIIQSYRLGYTFSSFWSYKFAKLGWITATNPDKEFNILKNMQQIKKFTFPVTLWDPKNIYFDNTNKTYKYEKYKELTLLPRRNISNIHVGDVVSVANASAHIYSKFRASKTLKRSPIIVPNRLIGQIFDQSVQSKNLRPVLQVREQYLSSIILFNPRIQDLNLTDRINNENILFSIKNLIY